MPEIRYWKVTLEREVKVSTTSLLEAVTLANRVFSGDKKPEDQMNVQIGPRDISLVVQEETYAAE